MRRQLAVFVLAAGTSIGVAGVQPASADCTVNVDVTGATCGASGGCTVNAAVSLQNPFDDLRLRYPLENSRYGGRCDTGGSCTVNLGSCHDDGACVVNTGECYYGDDVVVCHDTECDDTLGDPSEWSWGFGCRFDGGNELSGALFGDPNQEAGLIWAQEYVSVSDPTTNTIEDVTITCTMQSVPDYGSGGVSRSRTVPGSTGWLADTFSFSRAPGAPSYLCTTVEWNSTNGHSVHVYDVDDDSSNGYQCEEYTYTN